MFANLVQLGGTIVTAVGLAIAYGRAKKIPDQIRAWWHRIRNRGRHTHEIQVPGIPSSGGVGTPYVYSEFQLDHGKEVPDQLIQLEVYVRELRSLFVSVNDSLKQLGEDIERVDGNSESRAAQVLSEAKAEIRQFGDRLDELQAVDLKVAIGGVVITAIGIAIAIYDMAC